MMRPTLVLLPGLLCDHANWSAQCASLASAADTCVPDYALLDSLGLMAEKVLDEAPAPRFALAGHSMGGRVALEVVRRAPERVERLALLDTGFQALPGGTAGDDERAGRYRLLDLARTEGMQAMGRVWARGMVHPDRVDTPVFEDILVMIERKSVAVFEAQIKALLDRPDAGDLLPLIPCPTLVACGRQDLWSPVDRHEQMRDLIPGAWLEVIESSGHMVTLEQPDAVSQMLARWLAR